MIRAIWSPTASGRAHQPSPQLRIPRSRHMRAYSASPSSAAAGIAPSEWLMRYVVSREYREAVAVPLGEAHEGHVRPRRAACRTERPAGQGAVEVDGREPGAAEQPVDLGRRVDAHLVDLALGRPLGGAVRVGRAVHPGHLVELALLGEDRAVREMLPAAWREHLREPVAVHRLDHERAARPEHAAELARTMLRSPSSPQ